jgi:uncharacterized protein (DUF2141 family)
MKRQQKSSQNTVVGDVRSTRELLTRLLSAAVLCALLVTANAPAIGAAQSTPGSSELTVKISGLRNNKGVVGVALFSDPKGFPEAGDQGLQAKDAEIKDGSADVVFRDLAPGTYAVSVRHDENHNGKLDKNFLGIPKEGWGASTNPRPKRRAPKFEESKFELTGPAQTIEISVQY